MPKKNGRHCNNANAKEKIKAYFTKFSGEILLNFLGKWIRENKSLSFATKLEWLATKHRADTMWKQLCE